MNAAPDSKPSSPHALFPEILFEDQNLCVLNKPAGLLSQEDITQEVNLVELLRAHFGRHYVGLVHRLDRNTSGLMVVAKRSKAADRLSTQLRDGNLARQYRAWVLDPDRRLPEALTLKHYLVKNHRTNEVKAVLRPQGDAKSAGLTLTRVGSGFFDQLHVTLINVELETGRSHQIRVQLQAAGFPLLGDRKYGPIHSTAQKKESEAFGRPALHSSFLEFQHPISGERLTFNSISPPDWERISVV